MNPSRRDVLTGTVASFGAAVLSSCGVASGSAGGAEAELETSTVAHEVSIKGFVFEPDLLRVRPGDTITFTNFDIVPHTATALDKSWDTGHLDQNASATITVTDNMASDYDCLYHPNMRATLKLDIAG